MCKQAKRNEQKYQRREWEWDEDRLLSVAAQLRRNIWARVKTFQPIAIDQLMGNGFGYSTGVIILFEAKFHSGRPRWLINDDRRECKLSPLEIPVVVRSEKITWKIYSANLGIQKRPMFYWSKHIHTLRHTSTRYSQNDKIVTITIRSLGTVLIRTVIVPIELATLYSSWVSSSSSSSSSSFVGTLWTPYNAIHFVRRNPIWLWGQSPFDKKHQLTMEEVSQPLILIPWSFANRRPNACSALQWSIKIAISPSLIIFLLNTERVLRIYQNLPRNYSI